MNPVDRPLLDIGLTRLEFLRISGKGLAGLTIAPALLSLLGCKQEDIGVVGGVIERYFKDIFRSNKPTLDQINLVTNSIPIHVPPEMNSSLSNPFSIDEVNYAAFGMNPMKALMNDGMLALIFQKFW